MWDSEPRGLYLSLIHISYQIGIKENITLLHGYHYTQLDPKDKKVFTKKIGIGTLLVSIGTVSYTHLDVYKRQGDMLGLHSEFLPASKRYINDYVQYVKSDFLAGLGFGAVSYTHLDVYKRQI